MWTVRPKLTKQELDCAHRSEHRIVFRLTAGDLYIDKTVYSLEEAVKFFTEMWRSNIDFVADEYLRKIKKSIPNSDFVSQITEIKGDQ